MRDLTEEERDILVEVLIGAYREELTEQTDTGLWESVMGDKELTEENVKEMVRNSI